MNSSLRVLQTPRSNIRLLALLLLGIPFAAAQQIPGLEPPSGPIQFQIRAQLMDRALEDFAAQAKLQLIFVTDDIRAGVIAHEVSGFYLPEVALEQLLANSGLKYKFVNSHTVAIEPVRARSR